MDLITQGVLGALLAQTQAKTNQLAKALVIGGLAGMAPDLDVLIRSSSDPLLFLEFHRYFSHSLFFIPIGSLIVSLILHPLLGKRWQLPYFQTFLWCLIGFATHGLLDGCTSYGTQLLWPFTNERIAWSFISIIDPLFTLPLIIFITFAVKKSSRRYITLALLWMTFYLCIGYIQHQRAIQQGQLLAQQRGHSAIKLEAHPSFANLVVWRTLYQHNNTIYTDAVRLGISQTKRWQGQKIPMLNIKRDLAWLDSNSQQAKDIERFRWFSNNFIALDPKNPLRIIDLHHALIPNTLNALWGIVLAKDAKNDTHVHFSMKHTENNFNSLYSMVFNRTTIITHNHP